jgi:eukaryotic-like serine/threonine-protein kinase
MADHAADNAADDRLATERLALLLLDDLLDVPESARAAWIDAHTKKGAVRARLAAMLEADRIASLGARGSSRLGTGAAALGLAGPTPLPDRIGQYRITSLIGRGGMGAVYRGTRDADDFDHQAAIKVIKPGLLSEVLHQRFLAERQTLASLTHPNIARLYDGGSTEDGSPFIIMELIEGVPIDIWAGAQNLDTLARIRLVETAAGAIAHAHQRLIVHRDITPLNVLVQEDGTVKLIDFGIARPADAQGTTTATDIAALGRLLKRLVQQPGPELAAIIARATDEHAPYPSADAFAADLAALRTGWPVAAMAGTRRYRWRKFVGRNRTAVMAGAAALLLLLGGLVAIGVANAQARQAKADAEARFEQTRGIANALLFEAFDEVSRVPGATAARETLAQTAIAYLDALAAMDGAPPDIAVEAGRGYVRLAEVIGGGQSQSLGRYADANALLDRADALLAPAFAANPNDASTALAFAALRLEQAGTNLYNNNAAAKARAQAVEAEQAIAPFARLGAEAAQLHATALQAQGDSHGWTNSYKDARPLHQKAEAFIASLPQDLQEDQRVRSARSSNLRLLGESHHKLQEAPQARAVLDQAIGINRALLAVAPQDMAYLRKLAISLWYAAVVHRTNNRDAEARAAIEEAVALAGQMSARDPRDAGALQLVALTGEVLAQIHADRNDRAASYAASAEVITAHEMLVEQAGDTPGALRSMTSALRTMGGNRYNLGDVGGACETWRRTMANYQDLDRKGWLTDFDRKNGMPETAGYLRDICDGDKPRADWPTRPL